MPPRKNKGITTDPHAAREAEKYDHPIASREAIMSLLKAAPGPLNHDAIADALLERDLA